MDKIINPNYRVKISARSIDWHQYTKSYTVSCKQSDTIEDYFTTVITNDKINNLEIVNLPSDICHISIAIYIINKKLSLSAPIYLTINILKGDTIIDTKELIKRWDEESLTINLYYDL